MRVIKKRMCFTTSSICALIYVIYFHSFVFGSATASQQPELPPALKLCDTQQRQAFIDKIKQRRQHGVNRLNDYIRRTGQPKKWTDGHTVYELMAIENDQPIVYMTTNANVAVSMGTDIVRDDPYYLMSGQGITVGVWDAGRARPTHVELTGHVESKDGTTSTSNHSTHVTGTIAAAGIDPAARGIVPLSEVDNYKWDNDTIEMAAAAMSTSGEPNKIQISNHSYANTCGWSGSSPNFYWWGNLSDRESYWFGQYNYLARDFDDICYNFRYFLPFRGVGNDRGNTSTPAQGETYTRVVCDEIDCYGYTYTYYSATGPYPDTWKDGGFDTLTSGACAKNVLTIGAVNNGVSNGVRDLSSVTMYYRSAWGPTDDGRVKPDLVTKGSSVYSCWGSGDTNYYTWHGTSMATPAAAGAGVQLIDLHHQLFSNQDMQSSTLKGLMIHTADDLGNPGPDYKYGWGIINNVKSAEKILLSKRNPAANNIIEDSLAKDFDTNDEFIFEWDGISSIKATLCYTDPPGAETPIGTLNSTSIKLVNDLDVTITAPDGVTVYQEYVLDYVNPDVDATTGNNNRDNVKQVYIESPSQSGTYTVRVDYDTLNNFYNEGVQEYSLLISGQSQPPLYDIDGDGSIGFGDLASLGGNWLTGDDISDIFPAVGDDWVDFLDFSLLAEYWLNI